MSQHHRALAEAIGVVYHWELVTDELTIPVVSKYWREQPSHGLGRAVPLSLPRVSCLDEANTNVVTIDPTSITPANQHELEPKNVNRFLHGAPVSRYSGLPLSKTERQIYGMWVAKITCKQIAQTLKLAPSTARDALLRARAKMGEFDIPANPKE